MAWTEVQLGPVIGSEVTGIDLNQLDDALIAELRERLAERQVLVIRDQKLSREAHKAVARLFGTGQLHRHALNKVRGGDDEEVYPVRTTAESKMTAGEAWHTDVSCDPDPIAASLLYMHQAPAGGGGDTIYASMYECYDRLSPAIKTLAEGLSAVHDGAFPYRQVYGFEPEQGQFNCTVHPVVIRHPVTGRKLLWVNRGFTTRIKGLSHVENRHLLEMFFQHIESTLTAQCRVRWEDRTLVIWDNVATQHHAVWDYFPNSRYAERISVVGPVLEQS
ncbi:TauD/TfdA dioxygenase family protein [Novosphingobium sp. B 225]|uniref:TauD/TfdA dioxygenase family protein n=1 Tax=Novosphingobium sp. B 225 TaxID=1961849 RepID=UPI000B4C160E|nr:TauD/TfdA family dioxygenase [Novosphingobium sp. B 225]